jgi:hypothetical protein
VLRTGGKKDDKASIHMVSAFAARQRLMFGQVKVAEKSNEIIAIPKLLTMLAIEGAIVTIDAIGCQRDIARTILDKKADYVRALKATRDHCGRTSSFSPRNRNSNFSPRNRNQRLCRHKDHTGHHHRCRSRPHQNAHHNSDK